MQSACLVSDMESFKAANPGCVVEDFVRWYSPRDWVEDEDSTKENPKGEMQKKEANKAFKASVKRTVLLLTIKYVTAFPYQNFHRKPAHFKKLSHSDWI